MPKTAGLFDSIFRRRSRDLANQIAEEVSQRCDEPMTQWCNTSVQGASIDFLRGYVRATLAGEIRLETDNALRRHGASPDLQSLVIALVTEKLVDPAIRRILNSQASSAARKMVA